MSQEAQSQRPAASPATNGLQTGALATFTGTIAAAGGAYLASRYGIDPALGSLLVGSAAGVVAGILASLGSAARDYAHATPPTSLAGRFAVSVLSKLG